MNRLTPDNLLIYTDTCGHQWVFVYNDNQVTAMLRKLGMFAADDRLTFSWLDAARCCARVKEAVRSNNGQHEKI